MSLDRASFPARTGLQATSLSRPHKLHPLSFRRPTLSRPTSEIRLLRDTSLVKDVMSLSKFFSSFKPTGRHRAAQQRYEQPGGSMARNVPAPVEPITLPVRSSPQVARPLDDVPDMLANFRSRMWRTSSSPSSNCARMPTICEEFDAGRDAAASPSDRESLQTSAPIITGPVLKRRGGMSALTSLAEEEEAEEEEEETEYSSDAWDGYETDSPRSSFASDDSFAEKWSDALVPSSPSQKSSALLLSAQPVLLAKLQFAAPQSDSEAHLQARLSEHHRLVRKEMSVGNRVLLRR